MAIPGVTLYGSDGLQIGASGQIAVNGTVTAVSGSGTSATQSTTNTSVAVSASNTIVKATPGRLFGITITTVGTLTPLIITDGAAGTTIFEAVIGAAVGYYPISGGNVFNTNLSVAGSATNPVVVCHYA
jgi:hypothetical protein